MMTREDFDSDAAMVQAALFPSPDPAGTGDLFGDDQ